MSQVIWFLGGMTFALLCGLAGVLIAWFFIDRIREARKLKHYNLTLFGFGTHVFDLSRPENIRFAHNAKRVGYKIHIGKRVAIGLELPAWVWRIIKRKRGDSNA